ncbi:MAG: signal peptidase I [Planctomycetes bacterium]|nr:signal peptidase I [Planctomycetota bacterium]
MAPPGRSRLPLVFLACLALLLCLAAAVDTPVLALYRISGNSMLPAFENGDRVLVTTLGGIGVNDAVIVRLGGETLIKRVVAAPGDDVALVSGLLFRNGRPADPVAPSYRDDSCAGLTALGQDQFFVLGDNRSVSVDSRTFGPVERRAILGRVVYRWFPARDGASVAAARD